MYFNSFVRWFGFVPRTEGAIVNVDDVSRAILPRAFVLHDRRDKKCDRDLSSQLKIKNLGSSFNFNQNFKKNLKSKYTYKYMMIFILLLIITVILSIVHIIISKPTEEETIYCVMITGKDSSRKRFAKISIENFKRQTHENKKLIIVNESVERFSEKDTDILEINIQRKAMTLGDLRNIAFEFIPENSLWTVWDDDDWRHESYLKYLYQNLNHNDYVLFTKRIEHNLNTNYSWMMHLKTGFVTFLGRKRYNLKYDSVNVNEDVRLRKTIVENLKYRILSNNPAIIYIRFVHSNNTSVLIDKSKTSIKNTSKNKVYFEYEIKDRKTLNYIQDVLKMYD